ncbi:MAG: 1-(5-phosphoribosyl)-5-[Clostridia bacterium]|nr:1-(5-phosphoribosyl)-5-[(5-phosphoribosylamino)methylideneamino]imidazole-4-carboxamide isomerase [Clostridia bacterium]
MRIFPAIDLYDKKAVRLFKGDYNQMTVYSERPWEIAKDFEAKGAKFIHVVDLEGAKNGDTPNIEIVKRIAEETDLFLEIGGGIRSIEVVEKYLNNGADRVILGTSAVTDEGFLLEAVRLYGDKVAVGADVKDGYIAIKGWVEKSRYTLESFLSKIEKIGVKTVICTDISKDGAMGGTNLELYKALNKKYSLDIIASGGVSTIDDIKSLKEMDMYGAIIGKAYYTGAIDLAKALEVAK